MGKHLKIIEVASQLGLHRRTVGKWIEGKKGLGVHFFFDEDQGCYKILASVFKQYKKDQLKWK